MPDDSKAQRLGRKRDHVEAGVWLTMHEECPWAQDARDVTHGHAVEDVQGNVVPGCGVSAFFSPVKQASPMGPMEDMLAGTGIEDKTTHLTDEWDMLPSNLSGARIYVDTWGPALQDRKKAEQLALRLDSFVRALGTAQELKFAARRATTPADYASKTRQASAVASAAAAAAMDKLKPGELRPSRSHLWVMRLHNMLQQLTERLGDWQQSANFARTHTALAEQYFPKFHPANAQAYARRAKLESLVQNWEAVWSCATTARQRLAVCNPGSRLVAEMQSYANRACAEGYTPPQVS